MHARLWLVLFTIAGLFAAPQSLRADPKADQYRAEAKKLLKAAEELERKEKTEKTEKTEKVGKEVKQPKELAAKKKEKDDDDDDDDKKPDVKKKEKDDDDDDKKPEHKKKVIEGDKKPELKETRIKEFKQPAPFVKGLAEPKGPPQGKEPMMFKMLLDPKGGPDAKGPHETRVIMLRGGDGPQMIGMGGMTGMGKAGPGGPEQKLGHMMEAARHLREAGLNDMAQNIERAAAEMKRQIAEAHAKQGPGGPNAGELKQVIEQLRREVGELREQVKRMQNEGPRR